MTTLLGPMLPFLSARWSLSDVEGGYLFTAQFLASLFGIAISTYLTRHHEYRPALLIGLSLMAVGAGLLARANWIVGMTAVSLYGIGLGATIPTANLLIADLNPLSQAAALNLLNFSWGIGAVGSPFVIRILNNADDQFLYGVSVLLGISAVSMLWVPSPMRFAIRTASRSAIPSKVEWWSRFILILGILFFAYVGTENAVGGWIASYARRASVGTANLWTMTPSFFWGSLLLGRAFAPGLLGRMQETTLCKCGLSLGVLGIAILITANSTMIISLAAAITGLGFSSIYPAYIAMLSAWFGASGVRVGGLMFSVASLGGASLPWLVGAVSNVFGSLRTGLLVPLASTIAMLVLYLLYGSYRPSAVQSLRQAANSSTTA